MSRFSGKQYPGAMKDHRARKRLEANRRNYDYFDREETKRQHQAGILDPLIALAEYLAAPFIAFAEAFIAVGEALTGARQQTQDNFALVPAPKCGGAEVPPPHLRYLHHDQLPDGTLRLRNDTGQDEYILTRDEWDEISRQAKGNGDGQ